jgi:hypothetical protein
MVFEDNELVMYKENGKIYSAGFTVNSVMLQHGISPIISGGGRGEKTGGMEGSFNNLAIPAGLYYFDGLQQGGSVESGKYINEDAHISDDFYSTLLGLAENVEGEYIGGREGDKEKSEGDKKESEGVKEGQGKHKKTKKQRLLQEQKKRKTRKH